MHRKLKLNRGLAMLVRRRRRRRRRRFQVVVFSMLNIRMGAN
jgi:hypothetical protein